MKKSKIKQISILILALLLVSCKNNTISENEENSDKLQGTISISGAFALYPMTVRWAEEFKKLHPDVRIDISAGGAGKGMTDALSEMVDLGMFSREVCEEEVEKGAWKIALTKDAVLPTINSKNPFLKDLKRKGMSRQEFIDVYITEKIKNWGELVGNNDKKINNYTRSDACGAAGTWGKYLGGDQESLIGIGVFGDPGMADAIKKDILGVGYNNVVYIYDINSKIKYEGLEVIPIDINENDTIDEEENVYNTLNDITIAIKDGKYPSPPARDLYFVSQGKPEKEIVIEFIKWILTEGQKYVKESGYVQLSEEKIKSELDKICN